MLVLIFNPFGHLMTKGEKFELVFKRVYYMGIVFAKLQLSFFWNFIGSSCNLKPDGALILLDGALILLMHCALILHACSSLILLHACWISSGTIFHHAFQILHIICQMHVWITRYRGRSPWFNSSSVHCFKSKFLTMHIFRRSSSISCNQIPQYKYLHFICLSLLKT